MHIYDGILHSTSSNLHGRTVNGSGWVKTEQSRGQNLLPASYKLSQQHFCFAYFTKPKQFALHHSCDVFNLLAV